MRHPGGCLLFLLAAALPARAQVALFDRVVAVLGDRFADREFARLGLPELAQRYRAAAAAAGSLGEERAVVHAMLAEVPASHLALFSAATHARLEAELVGRRLPTLGCTLAAAGGRLFVDWVLDGSPAARAGLRRGDEVLSLDGVAAGGSPLLDWRSDDAHLDDPPTYDLLVEDGRVVDFGLAAGDGAPRTVVVTAAPFSALAASRASVRVLPAGRHTAVYVHLWYVFHGRSASLVRAALDAHPEADGLLLDLRGRGGSALESLAVVETVRRAQRDGLPVVALVDARTRSAKEVIAFELQARHLATLVGERTAGAVLPATFAPVGDDSVLMFPAARLGRYSQRIEGKGVEPDRPVFDPFPYLPGIDPVLAAGRLVLAELLDRRSGAASGG